ncbi:MULTISPECIES: response regulator transcription factor [Bacillus amyloliquefaciens group]|uniref:response regulator transcription factor n=1 Tax=Bacillus amyloliquefaciens group TaxID=1938374 RepID=UPI0002059914|nr:response regulator transcription factor [Bacillus amyloliquefaciens]AIW32308.1 LuxR family transcriptional regulator [Bacillus subtilis]AEB22389.1 two-component response regulator [Bacillus amyloliquefaciens TA208]AEK87351.1 two-component response regulator [Bacillus amyloliquefaciens XH7]MEC1833641.1 response regulator transcription factor [Bacillus amyloliquefaciens]MEC1835205.1 response regulator transcription factor [Bacillus amyloliquefaciens]
MNVMIADDQSIVREGLKMILSLHEGIEVSGEASCGEEVLNLLPQTETDVILMDIRMPGMDGIEATKAVKARYPSVKVIILTTFEDGHYIFAGLKSGADGYILKDADSDEIVASLQAVCEGNMMLNPKVTVQVVKALNHMDIPAVQEEPKTNLTEILTPRELDVAKHIMEGKSNKRIAADLFLTEGTVKNYVSRILDKLEVSNRTELTLYLQKMI